MIYYPANPRENDALAAWCADRIPVMRGRQFRDAQSIAVIRGNAIAAVWVFDEWLPQFGTMQFSAAAETPKWLTREAMRALLFYPFETVRVNKLWCQSASSNKRALKVSRGLGFKPEGTLRHQFGHGHHAVVSAMMRSEWLRSMWFMETAND